MIVLRVGDPHGKLNNLDEMKKLILFVVDTAKANKVDLIEILGDLFHTHAILRLEVIGFWTWALDLLSKTCQTVVLVGNHDRSGDQGSSDTSSLTVFSLMGKKNLTIVEKPLLSGPFAYVSYMHDNDEFVKLSNSLYDQGARVLVCHQTFLGSAYENGFYDPNGIDPARLARFTHIISGHIHAEQEFGNVIYPGTARWDTASDANRRKGIWIYTHDDSTGKIINATHVSTEKVCSPIWSFEYKEGDAGIPAWEEGCRVAVELVGSSAWVAQKKLELKGKCSIKTRITDKAQKTEARQTGKGLEDFMKNIFVTNMNRDDLLSYAREIGVV